MTQEVDAALTSTVAEMALLRSWQGESAGTETINSSPFRQAWAMTPL